VTPNSPRFGLMRSIYFREYFPGRRTPQDSRTAFRLLALLLQRPGEIVTREELQESLWPEAYSRELTAA